MDLAVEAGIKWIRAGQDWRYIEKMEPDGSIWWNWSVLDEIVDYANANGLNILLGCFSTPAHYGVSYNYLPNHLVYAWERFLRELVTRYKNRGVKYWGVWNEPNLNQFWAGTNDEYIYNVLIPAVRTIKSIDMDAKICAPDLSSAGNNKTAKPWINAILQRAGSDIDVITHHQYDGGDTAYGRIEQIEDFYWNYIVSNGCGNRPFWITETGWNTNDPRWPECDQALYLEQTMREMENRPWWNKTFWYELRDDPSPTANKFGILKSDNRIKYAWCGYKEHIKKILCPELYYPDNNATINTCTPTLKWKNILCKNEPHSCSSLI